MPYGFPVSYLNMSEYVPMILIEKKNHQTMAIWHLKALGHMYAFYHRILGYFHDFNSRSFAEAWRAAACAAILVLASDFSGSCGHAESECIGCQYEWV